MRVFVTGGTGMVGRFLIDALLKEGHEIRALVRPNSDLSLLDQTKIEIVRGDLSIAGKWMDAINGCDIVFHVAALMRDWGPKDEFVKHNIVATENILKAAKVHRSKRLVYVSTRSVMGMGECSNADETWPYKYSNMYGYSKMVAEQKVVSFYRITSIPTVIIRPTWIIGPRDRYGVKSVAALVKMGNPVLINNGEVFQSFVHPKDVVQALLLAMEKDNAIGQIYLVDSGERRTIRELFDCFARELNMPITPRDLPYWKAALIGRIAEWKAKLKKSPVSPPLNIVRAKIFGLHHTYSIDKAKRELGYAPRYNLEQMVHEGIEWWKQKQGKRSQ